MYNLIAILGAIWLAHALGPGDNPAHKKTLLAVREQAQDCYVAPYDVPVQAPSFPPFNQARANVFRYRQQQGVNLGSWFVHEKWMTSSVYRCAADPQIAEIDIAGGWGSLANARAVLENHWDSFITIDDFRYLASVGINTVRIPIGYWMAGPSFMIDTPFEPFASVYRNAWPRLLRAISYADQFSIGVLVDLHGAPGSQNGQHHSGVSDGQANLFNSPTYQTKTIEVLKYLVEQLGPISNVIGIQILNEPVGDHILEDLYERAIRVMRTVPFYGLRMPIYIHDAFDMNRFVPFVSGRPDFVVQDHHSYFVFTDGDMKKPVDQHTRDIRGGIAESLQRTASEERRNLIVGEWSCALTAESLSRQKNKVQAQRTFCTTQAQVYANFTSGWHFWSYKNEQCETDVGWCFAHAVGTALPPTFFSYDPMTTVDEVQSASQKAGNLKPPTDDEIASILGQSQGDNHIHRRDTRDFTRQVQHRFGMVYERLKNKHDQKQSQVKSARNSSAMKGFKAGYQAAQLFATYDMSKLGFLEQYVNDVISVAEPAEVSGGAGNDYATGFRYGLDYGERRVLEAARSRP